MNFEKNLEILLKYLSDVKFYADSKNEGHEGVKNILVPQIGCRKITGTLDRGSQNN